MTFISYPWIFPAQTAWQHRAPAKSPSNSFLFPFPWIRHGFSFDLKTDSILVILVSILAEKALSWSQENKPAATVQWPKSLVCKDEDSEEQGSNSKRDHQGREDHSTQSLSKASHLWWIQHRDSMMKHQNKRKQEYRQSISSAVGFQQSKVIWKLKKNQAPQSSKQKCAIQNHTDVNLTFKGLYITKNVSHNECVKSIQWGLFPVC